MQSLRLQIGPEMHQARLIGIAFECESIGRLDELDIGWTVGPLHDYRPSIRSAASTLRSRPASARNSPKFLVSRWARNVVSVNPVKW